MTGIFVTSIFCMKGSFVRSARGSLSVFRVIVQCMCTALQQQAHCWSNPGVLGRPPAMRGRCPRGATRCALTPTLAVHLPLLPFLTHFICTQAKSLGDSALAEQVQMELHRVELQVCIAAQFMLHPLANRVGHDFELLSCTAKLVAKAHPRRSQ